MKKLRFTAILFLLVNFKTIAQTGTWQVFDLNKLAQKDTLLTGWQMQAGDNRKIELPACDDSQWKPFDPSQDVKDLESGKSYWLRLRVNVDITLQISDFGFAITQNVASVVYLDGKQLISYGDLKNATAYNPGNQPVHVNLSPGTHIFLVHIVTPKRLLKFRTQDEVFNVFQLKINRYYKSAANYDQFESDNIPQTWIILVITGIFFILFVTHSFFFVFYRKQKAHLYYAIVTFFLLFEMAGNIILTDQHSPEIDRWVWFFELINYSCLIFFILILYTLFNYPGRGVIKFFTGLTIPFAIVLWFNGRYGYYLFSAVMPLMIALERVRIGIWAKRNKKSRALIVVTACCTFLVFVVVQILITGELSTLLFLIAMVSFPVGMSIFLAIQTAAVNRSLEKKLAEVEYLSEKNQQYQLEKQQILTDQNVLLEQQVAERTLELNNSLENLKAAQNKLVQSEKMASLGELTAAELCK
jgi:two-component system NtrC family sensor kinase